MSGCGSATHPPTTTKLRAAAISSAATSSNAIATADAVERCLRTAGYSTHLTIPPTAYGHLVSSPGVVDGPYEITNTHRTKATVYIFDSVRHAQAAAAPTRGTASAASFQAHSLGAVAYITWSGDPTRDIRRCGGG